ncbi:DoxX family protein [Herbiconiux sp.]|uniref:DoxX family protein n=1 Tax=Herbiconiux sp. TaxID=1871186 RepID=UPI0025C494FD|nr:DoxX family protein [Herbiconiux sp.]
MDFGILVLRLVVGGAFVGHGVQKLSTALGGHGLDGTAQMMQKLEMQPAKPNALAAGLAEAGGGAALALGLATPMAATGLVATMVTAISKVHAKNGPWNSGGGYEYNAVLIAAVTAIASAGPGRASVDAAFGKASWGAKAGVFALAAGAAGAAGAIILGKRMARAQAAAGAGAASTSDTDAASATTSDADEA